MIKNTQIKMIVVFIIFGLLAIGTIGIISINEIGNINQLVIENIDESSSLEISKVFTEKINSMKLITGICMFFYLITLTIVGIFSVKKIVAPITNFIKTFEENKDNLEQEKNKYLIKQKTSDEQNEFISAFQLITKDLNEDLNNIKEQKKQIETILVHMTDGIIAFNLKGEVIYINPAAISLLELEKEDNNFDSIFKRIKVGVNLEKLIYLDELTSSEQKVSIGNRYVTILFKTFKDRNDKNSGVIVLIQDITEHVKLDNMRKEFVADVSHELKTPITSIMGYADTLLEGDYDKNTQERFLNVIATEARRMAKLVTDLLTLSKHDNNNIQDEKVEFDLGELVKKCQEKLQIEIKKKHHHVECFVTANVPPVVADKYGIERVILNILTNSIKYTNENGNIKIYVGFVYNDAYIKVIDNGIGIPEEDLARIFERFYRVDKARTRQMGGTGLGLSIAKEILDRNNGSIDIKSEPQKGTEVVIRIPTIKQNHLEKEQ